MPQATSVVLGVRGFGQSLLLDPSLFALLSTKRSPCRWRGIRLMREMWLYSGILTASSIARHVGN